MNDVTGALVRATGLVAGVVCAVALASGLLFSARETGERRRPAWWLDLHQGLGGLGLVTVAVHVVASVVDSGAGIGLGEVLVPGAATTDRGALAWGVIGMYLIAAAVLTTWPRRIANRRLWRAIHVASIAGMVSALVHGYQMGSDATRLVSRLGLLALVAPMTYAVVVRGVDAGLRKDRGRT